MIWLLVWLLLVAGAVLFNRGAHRKPTPDPLIRVSQFFDGGVWIRRSKTEERS